MLNKGRAIAEKEGISNMAFEVGCACFTIHSLMIVHVLLHMQEGDASSLRYGEGAFDLVITRWFLHHLPLNISTRVCVLCVVVFFIVCCVLQSSAW